MREAFTIWKVVYKLKCAHMEDDNAQMLPYTNKLVAQEVTNFSAFIRVIGDEFPYKQCS